MATIRYSFDNLIRSWVLFILLGTALPAQAILTIEIVGSGENQIPIAVVPFTGNAVLAKDVSKVVMADLQRSALFQLIDPAGKAPKGPNDVVYADWTGVDNLVIGSVNELPNGRVEVKMWLLDINKKSELLAQAVSARKDQLRAISHRVADLIYEKLTGDAGIFGTRIAYINRQGQAYRLVVADSDGFGEQAVLAINQPILSPAWSPDGSHLAYVTWEKGHAVVYVQSLYTNQRIELANFPGSNSAPAWSPDGKHLALVLTRDGSSQIYLVRTNGSELRRLTFGGSIDIEPNFSPDGQHILFASDRGGSVQIYRMSVDGGSAERLTFEGGNNFSPRYSPDGKSFVFSHQLGGRFYVAVYDFESRQIQLLTEGGWEKKPSFSPNGRLVLYSSEAKLRGILATVSSDGRVKQRMFPQSGDIREPIWGPFLRK
ncbi:MAG: Tol-Pal system beta propeller repeat protein TolB [Candidatus Nitrotoga sp.]